MHHHAAVQVDPTHKGIPGLAVGHPARGAFARVGEVHAEVGFRRVGLAEIAAKAKLRAFPGGAVQRGTEVSFIAVIAKVRPQASLLLVVVAERHTHVQIERIFVAAIVVIGPAKGDPPGRDAKLVVVAQHEVRLFIPALLVVPDVAHKTADVEASPTGGKRLVDVGFQALAIAFREIVILIGFNRALQADRIAQGVEVRAGVAIANQAEVRPGGRERLRQANAQAHIAEGAAVGGVRLPLEAGKGARHVHAKRAQTGVNRKTGHQRRVVAFERALPANVSGKVIE